MQSQEEVQFKHFRKQLAACVRTIRWSYAIFWSLSARKEGLLEWNDGYYNGDIKTRKTTQITVCKSDQLGLQRSEQLRELYESLSTGDRNLQYKRPASLSPEDLTDAEWYYLVCMSFTFNLGQDLPGKVYECNEAIWLCNAQLAENRLFCRSLLAKSASIQTVVCLPFMDGVLEFGTSDLVMEDADFVKSITSSFWDLQLPVFSENSTSSHPLAGKEDENACTILDNEVEGTMLLENPALITQNCFHVFPFTSNALNKETEFILDNATEHHASVCEEIIYTPDDSSNVPNKSTKRMTGLLEGQMGHLTDDEFSNGFHEHLNYSVLTSPRGERVKGNMLDVAQVDNHAHLCSLDADGDGSHYASTISAVLAYWKEQTSFPGFHFKNCSNGSSFNIWKEGPKASKIHSKTPQRMLKRILVDGKWMNDQQMKYQEEKEENVPRNKSFKSEADDTNANHVLSERRRREKLNEKFVILRSLVPSISKVDKASILADTIEYLKELEQRVGELESCRGDTDLGMTKRSSYPDIAERTSDNYGNNRLDFQITSTKKRKTCEINEAEGEHPLLSTKGGAVDVNVRTIEKEVLVEMQCPWRNFLLLDLVEAMSNIQLDVHSVQASTIDGYLAITMRAKFVNTVIASPWMIKRALQRVVTKCERLLQLDA